MRLATTTTQTCRTCTNSKPIDEFSIRENGKRRSDCKACRAGRERGKRANQPERHTLTLMIQRCHNPKHPKFHLYGGRGITVCARWRESFAAFLGDVGPKPTPKHEIDRIDNDRGYEPGNCRWATRAEQMQNTRVTRRLTIGDRTQSVAAWERETGTSTILYRLRRGASPAESIAPPRPLARLITADGITLNCLAWSRRLGGNDTLVISRLAAGWSEYDAVTAPVGTRRAA